LKVPAAIPPQIDSTAATPALTTFGDDMDTLDIVRGQSQIPGVSSQPGSSQMRLGSEKPQLHIVIPAISPNTEPDCTPIQDLNLVEPVNFYPCVKHSLVVAR
jgi:hypothetical protein